MSLVETAAGAVAFIGVGILAGWLLFQFYVYRERIDPRDRLPSEFRHWALYGGIVFAVLAVWVYIRDPPLAWLFAVPAVGNFFVWIKDVRDKKKMRPLGGELEDG